MKEQCLEDALKDSERVAYFKSYLTEVREAGGNQKTPSYGSV